MALRVVITLLHKVLIIEIKKSRIVSVDDVNGKDLEDITVKVVSPEGDYSFKISQTGYLKAEKYHDFKEHGLNLRNY